MRIRDFDSSDTCRLRFAESLLIHHKKGSFGFLLTSNIGMAFPDFVVA